MALNPFSSCAKSATGPAIGSVAITPNNSADVVTALRAITIGGSGTVSWVGTNGVTYSTGVLPVGTYPMFAVRIRATGTTATNITGWL